MSGPSGNTQILVATKPVDFRRPTAWPRWCSRRSAPTRSAAPSTCSGPSADRVKLVWWDGTGLCLLSKRLEGGQFRWPRIDDGVMRLTPALLSALVEGLDWARVAPREVGRQRAAL